MMMYVQMCAIIKGECRHAVALLWHRDVPSCGLAIGPRQHYLLPFSFLAGIEPLKENPQS